MAFGAAYHFNNNRTFVAAHRLANFEPIMQSVRDLNKLDGAAERDALAR